MLHEILLVHIDRRVGSDLACQLKPCQIRVSPSNDRLNPRSHKQLQTEQSNWPRPRDKGDISHAKRSLLAHRMHRHRKRLAESALFPRNALGKSEELVRPNNHVTSKCAVHSMAHAAPLWAKHELPAPAIDAVAARDSGGPK